MKHPILLLQITALAVLIALFSHFLVQVRQPQIGLPLHRTFVASRLSAVQAVSLARQYSGFTKAQVSSVNYGKANDPTHPFLTVCNRPVWQVVFTVGTESALRVNSIISIFAVIIDGRTGALLKIASPILFTPGVSAWDRRDMFGSVFTSKELRFRETSAIPAFPFTRMLAKIRSMDMSFCASEKRSILPIAREISAYYGVNDADARSLWIIDLSGFDITSSNQFRSVGSHYTNLRIFLNARTGNVITYSFSGHTNDGQSR